MELSLAQIAKCLHQQEPKQDDSGHGESIGNYYDGQQYVIEAGRRTVILVEESPMGQKVAQIEQDDCRDSGVDQSYWTVGEKLGRKR